MTRMPRVTGKDMIRALEKKGFAFVRKTGSHCQLSGPVNQMVTVPVHSGETLSPILVKSILKQAGMDMDEFIKLL